MPAKSQRRAPRAASRSPVRESVASLRARLRTPLGDVTIGD